MIKLTKQEWLALEHRLSVPDALYEVLTSDDHDWWNDNSFSQVIRILYINIDKAIEYDPQMAKEIIKDCIEGSTWVAVNVDKAKAYSTLVSLAAKFESIIGYVEIPQ
jgi:hypothetical protein